MPRLVYMLVALIIAYKIVQFWTGITSTVTFQYPERVLIPLSP